MYKVDIHSEVIFVKMSQKCRIKTFHMKFYFRQLYIIYSNAITLFDKKLRN